MKVTKFSFGTTASLRGLIWFTPGKCKDTFDKPFIEGLGS